MADRREHPLHLVLAALVHDELDPARAEPPRPRGSACGRRRARRRARARRARRAPDRPRPRRRRPCRPRSGDGRGGGRARRRSSAAARRSCRRRAGRRGRCGPGGRRARRRSAGRRGSRAVVTTPGRLVQQHVGELAAAERPPVELDPVARRDERVQPPGLAVDRDPPGLDQLVGAAARGDARPGEPGVQPHRGSVGRRAA